MHISQFAKGLIACPRDTNIPDSGKLMARLPKITGSSVVKREDTNTDQILLRIHTLGKTLLEKHRRLFNPRRKPKHKNKIFGILHYITKINISINK